VLFVLPAAPGHECFSSFLYSTPLLYAKQDKPHPQNSNTVSFYNQILSAQELFNIMMSVSKSIRVAPHPFGPVVLKSPLVKPCRIAKVARNLPQVLATNNQHNDVSKAAILVPAMSVAVPLLQANPALAIDREYGILEGQIFSLMHPAVMFFLFGATVYTGYLGLQWRRTRALAEEIKELKAQRVPVAANAQGSEASTPSSKDGVEAEISKLEAVSFDFFLLFPKHSLASNGCYASSVVKAYLSQTKFILKNIFRNGNNSSDSA
jgi:hypothetical protein